MFTARGKAAGIETRGVSNHGFIDSIYFRDPNGYVIEPARCARATTARWTRRATAREAARSAGPRPDTPLPPPRDARPEQAATASGPGTGWLMLQPLQVSGSTRRTWERDSLLASRVAVAPQRECPRSRTTL